MTKKNTLHHIVELFAGTFINVIIGVITAPIITRLVSPDAYGQLSVFTLYENIIVMILCLGLDQALIRFYYRENTVEYRKNLIKHCILLPILIFIGLGGILVTLCFLGVFSFELGLYGAVLLFVCSLIQLIRRFSFIVLRLEYCSRTYSILHIVQKIIYVVCIVVFLQIISGYDFEVMAWSTIISFFAVTLASVLSVRRLWTFSWKSQTAINRRELLLFGMPFIVSMGLTTIFQAIDQLAIKYFCDFYEIGIYSSAMSIIHIFALVQTTFNAFWGPLSTEHYQANHDSNKDFYVKANDYICVIMFFMGIVLIMVKDLLGLFLGSEYRLAIFIIPCLVFSPVMQTISETTSVGINYSKKSYFHIIVSLIACIVNIAGNICLVPILGGKGAAISTGISYIVFFAVRTIFSVRMFNVQYKYGKIITMISVLLIYALYNTFYRFGVISLFSGFVCLAVWFLLYRKELIALLKQAVLFLKKKKTSLVNNNSEE